MPDSEHEATQMTPEASWRTIHSTMDQAHSSLYLAGTSTILLLWGAITALGYLAMFAVETLATDFADRNTWFPAPLWLGIVIVGMVASGIIGRRASLKSAGGMAARNAGIRVFLFWLAVVAAAFLVPGAAGLWNADASASVPGVAIGIVSLGYTLFGIMHRMVLAIVGIGIAAAYYIPHYVLEDTATAVTAISMLAIVVAGAAWLRKSGVG